MTFKHDKAAFTIFYKHVSTTKLHFSQDFRLIYFGLKGGSTYGRMMTALIAHSGLDEIHDNNRQTEIDGQGKNISAFIQVMAI